MLSSLPKIRMRKCFRHRANAVVATHQYKNDQIRLLKMTALHFIKNKDRIPPDFETVTNPHFCISVYLRSLFYEKKVHKNVQITTKNIVTHIILNV